MTVIERWGKLNPSEYFDFQMSCGSREGKSDLASVFKESVRKAQEQSEPNLSSCVLAAENATNRFEKALARGNVLMRMAEFLPRILQPALERNYHAFMDKLVEQAACECFRSMDSLFSQYAEVLVENCKQEKITSFRKEFLERVILKLDKDVYTKKDITGLFYELSFEEKIAGYVIGTLHLAPYLTVQDKRVSAIIERSSELVLECADPRGAVNQVALSVVSFGRAKSFESVLKELAKKRKLQISSLETFERNSGVLKFLSSKPEEGAQEAAESSQKKIIYSILQSPSFPRVQGFSKTFSVEVERARTNIYTQKLVFLKMCIDWLRGSCEDIFQFCREVYLPKNFQSICVERNKEWVEGEEGLVQKLKKGVAPFCVAVGAGHIGGEQGLLSLFAKEGISARQIGSLADLK